MLFAALSRQHFDGVLQLKQVPSHFPTGSYDEIPKFVPIISALPLPVHAIAKRVRTEDSFYDPPSGEASERPEAFDVE
jgi:hypothetical protein